MFLLSFFKKGLLRPKKNKNKLYLLEPAAPQAQNTSFLSTNIGLLVTQKYLGGLTSFTMVQVAEGQQKTDDRQKQAKNHKIQVDLIEVSLPQAEICIQGRSNYGKVSTFFFLFFF